MKDTYNPLARETTPPLYAGQLSRLTPQQARWENPAYYKPALRPAMAVLALRLLGAVLLAGVLVACLASCASLRPADSLGAEHASPVSPTLTAAK